MTNVGAVLKLARLNCELFEQVNSDFVEGEGGADSSNYYDLL